jgi:hypothetical protein
MEVVPFISLCANECGDVIAKLSTYDNQLVQLLSSKPELLKTTQVFYSLMTELVKYYLA